MKKKKLIMLFLILFVGCSWAKRDAALFSAYTTLNVIDIIQTREIFDNPAFEETNVILSKGNYLPLMIGSNILIFFIVDNLPEKYRTYFLGIITGATTGVVFHNSNIGIRF